MYPLRSTPATAGSDEIFALTILEADSALEFCLIVIVDVHFAVFDIAMLNCELRKRLFG
jgi:hypothetical protein